MTDKYAENSLTEEIRDENTNLVTDTQHSEILMKSKKPEKDKGKFWRFLKVIFHWRTLRLLLSHHPFCDPFEKHTYNIGKIRLCRGCLLSYPPAYAFPIIFLVWEAAKDFLTTTEVSIIENIWWFVIGFGVLAIGGRFLGRFSIFIKDLSKFGRGAWAGSLIVIILSQHWGFKIGAVIVLFSGLTFLSINRGKDMERTCEECEWHANYDICPGWKDISEHLAQVNLKPSLNPKTEVTSINQEKTNE